ncbi:hypothetical protein RI367_003700 [Sorochytrium milnesiophthora]
MTQAMRRAQDVRWMPTVYMTGVQAWREATRNRGQYLLGMSVVFITVVILAILFTALQYAPLIFLSMAESSVGEYDMQVTPGSAAFGPYLNLSRIDEELAKYPTSALYTPRKVVSTSTIFPASSCLGFNSSDPYNAAYPYTGMPPQPNASSDQQRLIASTRQTCHQTSQCLNGLCSKMQDHVTVLIIDSDQERTMGIGRQWTLPPVPVNSIYIQQDIADSLRLSVGDIIFLAMEFTNPFPFQYQAAKTAADRANGSSTSIPSYASQNLMLPATVGAIFDNTLGKSSIYDRSTVVVEYSTFFGWASNHLHPDIREPFPTALRNTSRWSFYQAVDNVLFTCLPPRTQCYMDSDFGRLSQRLLSWSNTLTMHLGIAEVSTQLSVLSNLQGLEEVSSFLGLILSLVIAVLGGLGVFLIYSLLMVSVETKTFELGVFRMVGTRRPGILFLLLFQALSYSIPALMLGLAVAQSLFIYVQSALRSYLFIDVSPLLTSNALVASVLMALVIPPLSSLLPIQKALSYNLHDSLDRTRSSTKHVQVNIERSNTKTPDMMVVAVGLMLFVFGFGIYYFLPLSLLTDDLALLFNIFLVILIGMITGMVVLSLNLLPIVERILISTLFTINIFEAAGLQTVLAKNMITHRGRNKKTSLLYTLSLGFIIFLTVVTSVELTSLQYGQQQSFGSDLTYSTNMYWMNGYATGITSLQSVEDYLWSSSAVKSYGWSTRSLSDTTPLITKTQLSNAGKVQSYAQTVRGVSPNFLEVMSPGFLQVGTYDWSLPYPPSEQLYTAKGYQSAVMGNLYFTTLLLDTFSDEFSLVTQVNSHPAASQVYTLMQPLMGLKAAPVLTVSDFSTGRQDMAISAPRMLRQLTGDAQFNSLADVPVGTLYITLADNVPSPNYRQLVADLRSMASIEQVQELRQILKSSSQTANTLALIFDVITVLIMTITFFSLNTSMYVNILEQKKEIAIMRSLGFSQPAIFRLYFYEALTLVLSSAFLGGLTGALMAWTITAQRSVLTATPIGFAFPWRTTVIVVLLSVVCAFLATVGPVQGLVFRKKLVSLLKE